MSKKLKKAKEKKSKENIRKMKREIEILINKIKINYKVHIEEKIKDK